MWKVCSARADFVSSIAKVARVELWVCGPTKACHSLTLALIHNSADGHDSRKLDPAARRRGQHLLP